MDLAAAGDRGLGLTAGKPRLNPQDPAPQLISPQHDSAAWLLAFGARLSAESRTVWTLGPLGGQSSSDPAAAAAPMAGFWPADVRPLDGDAPVRSAIAGRALPQFL